MIKTKTKKRGKIKNSSKNPNISPKLNSSTADVFNTMGHQVVLIANRDGMFGRKLPNRNGVVWQFGDVVNALLHVSRYRRHVHELVISKPVTGVEMSSIRKLLQALPNIQLKVEK